MAEESFDVGGLGQPSQVGPHFGVRGPKKYVNFRNGNGNQFNKPLVKKGLTDIADFHARSQYFKRAGFGAALRYTLGMDQVPSHVQDYMNSRQRRQTGLNPGDINAMKHPEADEW